jgi:hypothetical protein
MIVMESWTVVAIKMFVFMLGWDYVPELWPTAGLLFIPQMMYEYAEPWQNDIDRRKLKKSEKKLSHFHFVHHKSHMGWT